MQLARFIPVEFVFFLVLSLQFTTCGGCAGTTHGSAVVAVQCRVPPVAVQWWQYSVG